LPCNKKKDFLYENNYIPSIYYIDDINLLNTISIYPLNFTTNNKEPKFKNGNLNITVRKSDKNIIKDSSPFRFTKEHYNKSTSYKAVILKKARLSKNFKQELSKNFFYTKEPLLLTDIKSTDWIYKYFNISLQNEKYKFLEKLYLEDKDLIAKLKYYSWEYNSLAWLLDSKFYFNTNIKTDNNNYIFNFALQNNNKITFYKNNKNSKKYKIILPSGNVIIRENIPKSVIYDPLDNNLYRIIFLHRQFLIE